MIPTKPVDQSDPCERRVKWDCNTSQAKRKVFTFFFTQYIVQTDRITCPLLTNDTLMNPQKPKWVKHSSRKVCSTWDVITCPRSLWSPDPRGHGEPEGWRSETTHCPNYGISAVRPHLHKYILAGRHFLKSLPALITPFKQAQQKRELQMKRRV